MINFALISDSSAQNALMMNLDFKSPYFDSRRVPKVFDSKEDMDILVHWARSPIYMAKKSSPYLS